MNTSYFNKCKTLINAGYTNLVSIAGKTLPYFVEQIKNGDNRFKEYKKLAPKYDWWKQWHSGFMTDEQYIEKYYETVLNNLDANEVVKELGDDAILLCYEAPNKFCHRHIVAEWIKNKTGIEVAELNF